MIDKNDSYLKECEMTDSMKKDIDAIVKYLFIILIGLILLFLLTCGGLLLMISLSIKYMIS